MLGSDSGSSDLSEASSLSSDNSSGSESDVTKTRKPQRPERKALPPAQPSKLAATQYSSNASSPTTTAASFIPSKKTEQRHPHPASQANRAHAQTRFSSGSSSGSGSDQSSGSDSTDLDDDGNGGQGKRPPSHIRASKKHPFNRPSTQTLRKGQKDKSGPISLSASQPVYTQEIIDGSMMLLPTTSKFGAHSNSLSGTTAGTSRNGTSHSGRGRSRGRGRGALSGQGSRKYDASNTIVVDFEDGLPLPEGPSAASVSEANFQPSNPTSASSTSDTSALFDSKVDSSLMEQKPAPPKLPTLLKQDAKAPGKPLRVAATKPKPAARKVGRPPKSVSKDVYCICRGPYDGTEFMIACDRCEEWFHGSCIGMRPQDAKKSNHYFCETCQKIRRMLGITTVPKAPPKPAKQKPIQKKVAEKLGGQGAHGEGLPKGVPAQPTLSSSESRDDFGNSANTVSSTEPVIPKSSVQPSPHSVHHGPLHSDFIPPVLHVVQSSKMPSQRMTPEPSQMIAVQNTVLKGPSSAMDDEDDEDVCPVCDFECTCNTAKTIVAEITIHTVAPVKDDSHVLSSMKVPFRPAMATEEQNDEEPGPSVTTLSAQFQSTGVSTISSYGVQDDSFHTSFKNPMTTPAGHRRPSISRRSGKGIGKLPRMMQAAKNKTTVAKRMGKGMVSGKASMHLYRRPSLSSESDMSEAISDEGEGFDFTMDELQTESLPLEERQSDMEGHDMLSYDSSSSLSVIDDNTRVGKREGREELSGSEQHATSTSLGWQAAGKGWSRTKKTADSNNLSGDMTIRLDSADASSIVDSNPTPKKRGPGRPKKQKDPLFKSVKDEEALYKPAVASRKQSNATQKRRGSASRIHQAPSMHSASADFPFLKFDKDVAQDVMAAFEDADSEREEGMHGQAGSSGNIPEVSSDDDIFGEGDLSDELSGDLSDILTDDLDDLSDDDIAFSSSDEESSGSSPREFHYSELEEQDESLVDSDSSINSLSTDPSDSSDLPSDSENEDASDGEESDTVGQEVFDDSFDEEEFLRLEEQERLFLAKAHSLHEDSSEESDPSRNPFDSSEDDLDDADDDDGQPGDPYEEDYGEGFYGDDYYDYDSMDEQDIFEQLKGVQVDIQALMMIPPEQQEQFLLLQHYAETHQQQLQRQQQQSQHQPSPDTDLLPALSIHEPDLDAVSEQLAKTLANSMTATRMAGNLSIDMTTDIPSAAQEQFMMAEINQGAVSGLVQTTPALDGLDALGNVSPQSTSSVSPAHSSSTGPGRDPPTPASFNSTSTTIPTPADTPTPPETTADTSPSLHVPSVAADHAGKRKADSMRATQVDAQHGKRRKHSQTANTFNGSYNPDLIVVADQTDATQSTPSSSMPASTRSGSASSKSMSPSNTGILGVDETADFDVANVEERTLGEYDFSKGTMPFEDPAARMITSTLLQPNTALRRNSRSRRPSFKEKDLYNADSGVMPMDDLLDTSALYGRSTSRSPSPDGTGVTDSDAGEGISQTILKDLHRWERVPIGTFRKSRRPSSPYVGLQGALKFGNVAMPTTLLTDHPPTQHSLPYETSRPPPRRVPGIKKHRSTSSVSDILVGSQLGEMIQSHGRADLLRHQLDRGLGRRMALAGLQKHHPRQLESALATMSNTPPSIHAGMAMEDLAGFGSIEGVRHQGRSSEPTRRRRHRTGIRLTREGQFSSTELPIAGLDLHSGLGIGTASLVSSNASVPSKTLANAPSTIGGSLDLMTDSSQLPSSACPTPLHSPLFGATGAVGRSDGKDPAKAESESGGKSCEVPVPPFELGKARGFEARVIGEQKELLPVGMDFGIRLSQPLDEVVQDDKAIGAALRNATYGRR